MAEIEKVTYETTKKIFEEEQARIMQDNQNNKILADNYTAADHLVESVAIDWETLDKINKKEYISTNKSVKIVNEFIPSGWTCYLFGGDQNNGIAWSPAKGKVPNIFVRWMMKLCFACTWVKK